MRVSRLELQGFKSFASPACLEFGDGVTAVVGPNGSGKSNLVDAIRLVLGGASARELRGQRLEQVIFSGGERRAALGMAEVTVVFDNEDGRMPVDDVEVALSRRVFRDGASEFRRNGQRIRLRDLGRLLDATGLAQAGYAIIAQNDIESIIRATPAQRRHLIEEAAGVRGAQVLLDDSRDRILELDRWLEGSVGRLAELTPRLDELRLQAQAAAAARQLKERLDRLRGSLERAAWLDELTRARQLERQLDASRRRRESAARALAEFDAHYRDQRRQLELVEEARLEQERVRGRMALLVQQAEAALERWRERAQQGAVMVADARLQLAEVVSDLEALSSAAGSGPEESAAELEGRRAALADLASRRVQTEAGRRDLRRQLEEAERQAGALARRLADNLRGQAEQETALQQGTTRLEQSRLLALEVQGAMTGCREELESAQKLAAAAADQSRRQAAELEQAVLAESGALELLSSSEAELARITAQERAAAAQHAAHQALIDERRRGRPIADAAARGDLQLRSLSALVRPRAEGDTVAVEAALGDLGAALVGAEAEARRALARAGGEAEVICWPTGDQPPVVDPPAGCRPLVQVLEGEAGDLAVIAELCHHICLAEDRSSAQAWLDVTPQGRAVLPDGSVVARGLEITPSSSAGAIQTLRQAERAHQELGRLRDQMDAVQARVDWARDQHQRQRARVDQARAEAARSTAAAEHHHQIELRLADRLQELGERAARTQRDQERDRAQLVHSQTELEKLRRQCHELEELSQAAQARLQSVRESDRTLAEAAQELAASQERLRLEVAEIEVREQERLQRARQQGETRRRLLERERAARTRVERAEDALVVALTLADRAATARASLALEAAAAQPVSTAVEVEPLQQLALLERQRAELESELNQVTGATQGLERDLLAQRTKVEQARIRLGDAPADGDEPPLDPVRTAQEIARLEHRVRALGPVNELAPAQLEDLLARTEGMRAAHADTTAARGDIEAVLGRLRQLVDARLGVTMAEVTREFESTWRELFGSGRATLLRVDAGADGAWGVEMEVQPQGKRVIPMGMLSGGERALTALALILALQQVSPSPFYVFDEVDAALDEVNVANFARILSLRAERSQFLVVTHSLTTMARAAQLYGVTQDGRGSSRVLSVRLSEDGRSIRDQAGQELAEALVGG